MHWYPTGISEIAVKMTPLRREIIIILTIVKRKRKGLYRWIHYIVSLPYSMGEKETGTKIRRPQILTTVTVIILLTVKMKRLRGTCSPRIFQILDGVDTLIERKKRK